MNSLEREPSVILKQKIVSGQKVLSRYAFCTEDRNGIMYSVSN